MTCEHMTNRVISINSFQMVSKSILTHDITKAPKKDMIKCKPPSLTKLPLDSTGAPYPNFGLQKLLSKI